MLVLEATVTFNILFFGRWVFFLLHNQLSLITWRLYYIELTCLALVSRGCLVTGLSCTSQSSLCNCSVRSYCNLTLHWRLQVYISVKGMWLEGKSTFTRQWCAKNRKFLLFSFALLHTDDNIVKTSPVHTNPRKRLKMQYYACQTSSWYCKETQCEHVIRVHMT